MAIILRCGAVTVFFVCVFAGAACRAFAGDPDVEALRAQLQALMDRVSEQEKALEGLKAQQALLMEQLEKRASATAALAAAPREPLPLRAESAAKSPTTSRGKTWFADHVTVGGYGSVRFEANDLGETTSSPAALPTGSRFAAL